MLVSGKTELGGEIPQTSEEKLELAMKWSRRVDSSISRIKELLDPIDLAFYEPHVKTFVETCYIRCSVLFGSLVQLHRSHVDRYALCIFFFCFFFVFFFAYRGFIAKRKCPISRTPTLSPWRNLFPDLPTCQSVYQLQLPLLATLHPQSYRNKKPATAVPRSECLSWSKWVLSRNSLPLVRYPLLLRLRLRRLLLLPLLQILAPHRPKFLVCGDFCSLITFTD